MNNEQLVIEYINRHGSITVREASNILYINSPTKVLSNIRKKGFPLIETWKKNPFSGKRYKVYTLKNS